MRLMGFVGYKGLFLATRKSVMRKKRPEREQTSEINQTHQTGHGFTYRSGKDRTQMRPVSSLLL